MEATQIKAEGAVLTIASVARDESERNPIFDALVSPDGEVSGLVAYSIYKQNKRAWLDDFVRMTGRTPTEAETRAYIIGESTERRLATYKQLAAATLTGQGTVPVRNTATGMNPIAIAIWALVVVLGLAALGFALHASGVGMK